MWQEIKAGQWSRFSNLKEQYDQRIRQQTKSTIVHKKNSEEEESSEDDDNDNENENLEKENTKEHQNVRQQQQQHEDIELSHRGKAPIIREPIIDEDGFELVQKPRRR